MDKVLKMKGLLKCGLYALSFAVLSIGFSIGFSDSVNAQPPHPFELEHCDELNANQIQALEHYFTEVENIDLDDHSSYAYFITKLPNWTGSSSFKNARVVIWAKTKDSNSQAKVYLGPYHHSAGFDLTLTSIYLDGTQISKFGNTTVQENGTVSTNTGAYPNTAPTSWYRIFNAPELFGHNDYNYAYHNFGLCHNGGVNIDYLENYEGITVPDEADIPDEVLEPQYDWTVTKNEDGSGKLNIKYRDNIKPFLTGTSYYVLDKTTDNWESIDQNIDTVTVQPAGWGDEDLTLPGLGYYQVRIDHNQQLDSPPWDSEVANNTAIGQVWIQFYWDGKKTISGNTIGCVGSAICNDHRDQRNKIVDAIDKLNIDDHGLQSIIYTPLAFAGGLFNVTENCTPINFNFLGSNQSLPCIRQLMMNSAFGSGILIAQVAILGMTMYFISVRSLALIKQTADPDDDKIEVTKL